MLPAEAFKEFVDRRGSTGRLREPTLGIDMKDFIVVLQVKGQKWGTNGCCRRASFLRAPSEYFRGEIMLAQIRHHHLEIVSGGYVWRNQIGT